MLTGNSIILVIILAVIGLTKSERIIIPSWFVYFLIGAGLLLCLVWIWFMVQGVHAENDYRRKAETLEKRVLPIGEKIVICVDDPRFKGFLSASFIVVYIFCAIYIASILLFYHIN